MREATYRAGDVIFAEGDYSHAASVGCYHPPTAEAP
jgi:hypothetical protein